jgi:hypothetical protein
VLLYVFGVAVILVFLILEGFPYAKIPFGETVTENCLR